MRREGESSTTGCSLSKRDRRELVSSAAGGGDSSDRGGHHHHQSRSTGIDLHARKGSKHSKRDSIDSSDNTAHREYVHRLSVGSPTSPSQKLFLHSLRERHLDEEGEQDREQAYSGGSSTGRHHQQHQHIEHLQPGETVGGDLEGGHSLSAAVLSTSWDSAIARKADRKRHFTSRRQTVNKRGKAGDTLVYTNNSSRTNTSKLAGEDISSTGAAVGSARPGDRDEDKDHDQALPYSSTSQSKTRHKSKGNSKGESRNRSGASSASNKRRSGRSSRRGGHTAQTTRTHQLSERGTRANDDDDEQGSSSSRLAHTHAAGTREPAHSRQGVPGVVIGSASDAVAGRQDHQQGQYEEYEEESDEYEYDEEGGSSTSEDENSAIEDLMSQIKMSECLVSLSLHSLSLAG